jgi:D-serine deaminase-like pyridoxal phosphate-dependent protein
MPRSRGERRDPVQCPLIPKASGMTLHDLETPALVLDEPRMARNIKRMRTHLQELGVSFRPHLKTCKSIDVARRMMAQPAGPVTVSTLKEAEYFLANGVTDILYAVGIAPNKLPHVLALRAKGANLTVILDNVDAARAVGMAARDADEPLAALIEIDSDGHRSGVAPDDPLLLEVAAARRSLAS